jgi:hypothetical protein
LVIKITGKIARLKACQAINEAPEGWVMRLTEPTRSLEANALLHAELQEVAERVKWAGERRTTEDWKRLLTCAWMRATGRNATLLPAVDGNGFDVLYRRTSTMTKTEMSELIEYVRSWKADRPELERERSA